MKRTLPPLPKSWSELSWQQLCAVWACKVRFGGNPDVARAAALISLCRLTPVDLSDNRLNVETIKRYNDTTGETVYTLRRDDGSLWTVTPSELSQMAKTMTWFQFPYGDPGKPAVKDEKGLVIEEAVDPVRGYVSEMRDAMILPEQELVICNERMIPGSDWKKMTDDERQQILHSSLFTLHFSLPQMACNNLTWQQYRSLQAIVPILFQEGISDDDALQLHAEFLAQILVPARNNSNTADRFAPKHDFSYNAERAEQSVAFWMERLKKETTAEANSSTKNRSLAATNSSLFTLHSSLTSVLFHICFQCYQTALTYYVGAYPLLFSDSGKQDLMKDALQGEVGTINTIMKYAGYAEQQQVYDSNLPFILDILNTMTKEAKDIEAMNARIKRKH